MALLLEELSTVHSIQIPAPYDMRTINLHLIQRGNSLILVDAGVNTESCWDGLVQGLHRLGFAVSDISCIVLTHSHIDHIGLLSRITSQDKVPVYAHPEAFHRLNKDQEFQAMRWTFFEELYESMGCGELGRSTVEGMRVAGRRRLSALASDNLHPIHSGDYIAGLSVLETPGHSPDHAMFIDYRQRLLFSGDMLIRHMPSNAMIEPNRMGQRLSTLVQYMASLEQCMKLGGMTAYPGHGQPITDLPALARLRLQRIRRRIHRIQQFIANGISVPVEIAVACYKELYVNDFSMVMSELIGCLDYLEAHHQVTKRKIGTVWHYQVTTSCNSNV